MVVDECRWSRYEILMGVYMGYVSGGTIDLKPSGLLLRNVI